MHMCRIPYAVQFVWERKRRRRGETTQYNKEKKILTQARYPSRLTSVVWPKTVEDDKYTEILKKGIVSSTFYFFCR